VPEPDEPFPRLNDAEEMRRRVLVVRAISMVPYALLALLAVAGALLSRRARVLIP
jgi:hypothetical protein